MSEFLGPTDSSLLRLGIDASNLQGGGGLTHLFELLAHAHPHSYGFGEVIVWGPRRSLSFLQPRDWLILRNSSVHEASLLRRAIWQTFELPSQARAEGCHILLSPGGSHSTNFRPCVTISQNMLPFQVRELLRFGLSLTTLRLLILRWIQSRSFKAADGAIFLTHFAERQLQSVTGPLKCETQVIPHGVSRRFFNAPREQYSIGQFSIDKPYRLLYVSIVDQYKHQWHLVESVGRLRLKTGWPLVLDFVGPANPQALRRLKRAMARWDPVQEWVSYRGAIPHADLHQMYQSCDLGLFSSTCENLPIILLEMMAAGLPIASSRSSPMKELLGDAALFFNPEIPSEIEESLYRLICDPALRSSLSARSYVAAQQYTWDSCADYTFKFLAHVYRKSSSKEFLCAA